MKNYHDGDYALNKFSKTSQYKLQIKLVDWIPHFFVSFNDGQDLYQETEVSLPVYMELLKSTRSERNQQRWDERYTENSALIDETLYNRAFDKPNNVEDEINESLLNEQILQAIRQLPKAQQRRLMQYYETGLTYEQIAEIEGCSHNAVVKTVKHAEAKIKEFLQIS